MLACRTLARLSLPKTSARDVAHLSQQLRCTVISTPLALRAGYATATATKSRTTTKKAAATTTKKPATKTAAKKPAAKKTAAPKKKTAAAAKETKPKKRLTEKQKEARDAKKARDEIKELKEKALKEPKGLPANAYQVFFQETVSKEASKKDGRSVADIAKTTAERYKNMSPAELEQLNHRANESRAANAAAYKKWLESYTPAEIRQANQARASLRRKTDGKYRPGNIKDDRLVKGSKSAYVIFCESRWKSGDLANISVIEAAKLMGQEWKKLGAAEKKKFDAAAEADVQRYIREHKEVYGEEPRSRSSSPSP
ncbi:uncharacterized protein K452DRAFT_295298 [Aplosporella prunicola CBS 121167]|uniref:HMG box domain-containing protein n=1 Tax=Aplosporella prunicola CBS 121167 TaxID=1176127 RepID=A0A6A6BSY2_9PEZI|nr:uncharacterized protein K452DRAFT_295298 [Aplosporella prunicola CBS 121167]KAF2145711.1 hypothetical protein K452DRAFT_295298 [Aplosporella prunicola CBS 121167]